MKTIHTCLLTMISILFCSCLTGQSEHWPGTEWEGHPAAQTQLDQTLMESFYKRN